MTDEAAAAYRPTQHVSRALAHYRQAKRLTYTEISAKLAELGQPIPTLGLTRIEKGERRVDVDEVIALAHVFGVPPLSMLFPVGGSVETEILPGRRLTPWEAAKWFTGKEMFGVEPKSTEATIIGLFEKHDTLMEEAGYAHAEAELWPPSADDPEKAKAERRWRIALRDFRFVRAQIRNFGLEPPALEPGLEKVDDSTYRFLTREELETRFPNSTFPPGLVVEDKENGDVEPVNFAEKGARPRDAGEGKQED